MMIAGIGGGIGFLAICVIVGVAIYRRMKKVKKGSQVRVSSYIVNFTLYRQMQFLKNLIM